MHDGLVVVDKPAGCTSHDVVAKLRKVYGQRRVGHAGTLDPDATGVLLVGLGRATRLLRFLRRRGRPTAARSCSASRPTRSTRRARCSTSARCRSRATGRAARCRAFVGDIEQVPPMVSAIKIDGRRLHELAARARRSSGAPRPVHVDRSRSRSSCPAPTPRRRSRSSASGTYVRSLAADLGTALGGCAHLGELRRAARRLVRARRGAPARRRSRPIPTPRAAARGRDARPRTRRGRRRAGARGRARRDVRRRRARRRDGDGPFAVVDDDGELLAVYERRAARREARGRARPRRDADDA